MLNTLTQQKSDFVKMVNNRYVKDHYGVNTPGIQYDSASLEEIKLAIILLKSNYECKTVTCQ